MNKPRFVVETDDEFKKNVKNKACLLGKTYKQVIIDFLKRWVKK